MTRKIVYSIFILVLLFFLSLIQHNFFHNVFAASVTYYLDNSCTNNGNGLSQTCATSSGGLGPFNSLANAQSKVTGDKSDSFLLLKKGQTYPGQFTVGAYGTAGHPFTVSSYGTGKNPVITGGSANIKISCTGCAYIVIDGITGVGATGNNDNGAGVWIGYPAHHITIQNSDISGATGSWAACIQIDDSSNNIINGNSVHDCPSYGIMLFLRNPDYGVVGNTISNNKVFNDDYDNDPVRKSTFGINGITSTSAASDLKRVGASLIYGNEVYGFTAGIYFHFMDDSRIYRNKVHNNGVPDVTPEGFGEDYGFGVRGCSNNDFYENEVYDNYDYAWNMYGDQTPGEPSDNNKIYRNYISGTNSGHWGTCGGGRGLGIGAPVGDFTGVNNAVFNNIIWGNDTNFIISDQGGSGNVAYGNVLYGGCVGLLNERQGAGWTVSNNIFAENSTYLLNAGSVSSWTAHANNLYYRSNGGTIVRYNGVSYTPTTTKSTFETSSLITNPKFIVNPPVRWSDFSLQAGSPAIDAGLNLGTSGYNLAFDPGDITWPPTTADQNNYGSGWEIGPFVYSSGSSPTPTNSPTSTPCPLKLLGDSNCSGTIDITDLNYILNHYGGNDTKADLDSSGKVNLFDLGVLIRNFGKTG